MRVRVTYIASIPDEEMLAEGVDLGNLQEVADYFYENGGEEAFHDYGENFEILR